VTEPFSLFSPGRVGFQKINALWLALLLLSLPLLGLSQSLRWQKLAELPPAEGKPHPGLGGAYAGVHNGVLLIAGGANFPEGFPWEASPDGPESPKIYHDTIHALVPQTTPPSVDGGVGWVPQRARLPHALAYGVAITTTDGILCFGGEWKDRPIDGAQRLHLSNMAFALVWDTERGRVRVTRRIRGGKELPDLPAGLSYAGAANVGDKIYVACGIGERGAGRQFYELNLNAPSLAWKVLPDFPGPARVVSVAAEGGDAFYLMSGRDPTTNPITVLRDFWRYRDGAWTRLPDLPRAMMAGAALGGRESFLVVGGSDGARMLHIMDQMQKANAGDPAAELRWRELQRTHPGFSEDVHVYDIAGAQWIPLGNMPAPAPVTTRVVRWRGGFVVLPGEIRPGVRDPTLWIGKR